MKSKRVYSKMSKRPGITSNDGKFKRPKKKQDINTNLQRTPSANKESTLMTTKTFSKSKNNQKATSRNSAQEQQNATKDAKEKLNLKSSPSSNKSIHKPPSHIESSKSSTRATLRPFSKGQTLRHYSQNQKLRHASRDKTVGRTSPNSSSQSQIMAVVSENQLENSQLQLEVLANEAQLLGSKYDHEVTVNFAESKMQEIHSEIERFKRELHGKIQGCASKIIQELNKRIVEPFQQDMQKLVYHLESSSFENTQMKHRLKRTHQARTTHYQAYNKGVQYLR
uniref:Uncharacterized protein n=2 Tax=Lotharella oceanica TaxID=641309 RepID=A0A7S2XGL6_9EUKA|mmetsp:Transcript_7355/g.14394  ORF Transcript_7355/g.14394 Transcript_7355/m.14394 type:complete len:281 (+) Transcript_7355:519-1361(+)